jgi:hypothetical protein
MKPLIIIGCAPNWEDDFEKAKITIDNFDVMAIGLDCPYSGRIKFFTTYHFTDIQIYKIRRASAKCNMDFKVICHKAKPDVDIIEPHKEPTGSSSLLGVVAAISEGYKKIILCGCPMQGKNKCGTTPYEYFQRGWTARIKEIKDYTRSMSGYTKDLLGEPTKDWLIKE